MMYDPEIWRQAELIEEQNPLQFDELAAAEMVRDRLLAGLGQQAGEHGRLQESSADTPYYSYSWNARTGETVTYHIPKDPLDGEHLPRVDVQNLGRGFGRYVSLGGTRAFTRGTASFVIQPAIESVGPRGQNGSRREVEGRVTSGVLRIQRQVSMSYSQLDGALRGLR